MKLVFLACAQSTAVDAQTQRLSLFHVLEQVQSAAFPVALHGLGLVAMFAKEAGDQDSHSLRLKIALGDAVLLETPVAFSFQGNSKGRVIAGINGLALPGPGVLSFSIVSDGGSPIGSWEVTVEQAVAAASQAGAARAAPEGTAPPKP